MIRRTVSLLLSGLLSAVAGLSQHSFIVHRTQSFSRDFSGSPIPRFAYGRVVGYDASRSRYFAFDEKGALLAEGDLSQLGLGRTSINDIAAAPDGRLALATTIMNSTGLLGNAIVWTTSLGAVIQVVSTTPFGIRRLAFASDGSLWTAGRAYTATFQEEPAYDVLRQYDSTGKLVRTALSRATLTRKNNASVLDCFLATSGSRVAFISVGSAELIELTSAGEILSRANIPFTQDQIVTGMAMDAAGKVFVSLQANRKPPSSIPAHSIDLYLVDPTHGALTGISTNQIRPHGEGVQLMGSDDSDLVLRLKPPQSLAWIQVD